jgi:hypothetical protein
MDGSSHEGHDVDDMVPCMTLGDASLVPHAKAMLEAAGIPYHVKHDAAQHLFGGGTLGAGFNLIVGAPVVMVRTSAVEQARALLAELEGGVESAASPATQPLNCPACHVALKARDEDDEGALTHCYHCGSALDE